MRNGLELSATWTALIVMGMMASLVSLERAASARSDTTSVARQDALMTNAPKPLPQTCICCGNKSARCREVVIEAEGNAYSAEPPWLSACGHKRVTNAPPDEVRWVNRTQDALIVTFLTGWPFPGQKKDIVIGPEGSACLPVKRGSAGNACAVRDYEYRIRKQGMAAPQSRTRTKQQGPGVVTDD